MDDFNDDNISGNISNGTSCPTETNLYIQITGTILFVIVWPFIVLDMKFFPLGRPAAALVGAVLMVMFHIVTQDDVYEIEGDKGSLQTVFLLVGMMMLSYYYDREGLLRVVMLKIFGQNKPFHTILWKVCLMSALLSAFITNDAACLVITPLLLLEFIKQDRNTREMLPLCLGIATSANIGSAATVFGNPQNAFIASEAGVTLLQFFIAELPASLLGLAINIGLIYLLFIRTLCTREKAENSKETPPKQIATNMPSKKVAINMAPQSLSAEREAVVLAFDQSDNPYSSSNIAKERERLFQDFGSNSQPINEVNSMYRSSSMPTGFSSGTSETVVELDSISSGENVLENTEDVSNKKEKQSKRAKFRLIRAKLFIVWLVVISIIMVILLAIPPSVAEFNLGCIPLAASILTMLVDTILNRKYAYDVMLKIDWTVILMFMGLFVWLEGFQNTCFPFLAFNKLAPYMNLKTIEGVLLFSVFVMVGSNLLSNVPLVILIVNRLPGLCGDELCEGPLGGLLLAWISTIAGNFTLIGSIANLIVAEKARSSADYRLTFWGYLKFGFPSTLVIIYACLPIVYYMGLLAAKV